MDSKLGRSLGHGPATGDVHRSSYRGICTVAKLASRVAARVGRSDMAPVFIHDRRNAVPKIPIRWFWLPRRSLLGSERHGDDRAPFWRAACTDINGGRS